VAGWTWGNGRSHTRSFDLHGRLTAISHLPAAALDQGYGYDHLHLRIE
jgi:hypothetical protein